jgi:hypothetical protein
MVFAQEPRADTSVIDCNEFVVVVCLLGMLAMVHVTQIELLALEKDDG